MSNNTRVNDAERWSTLGLELPTRRYDVKWLDLSVEQLAAAVREGYCDPRQRQNDSPTVAEFLAFAKEHGGEGAPLTFECYIVSPERSDCRISVEGVRLERNRVADVLTGSQIDKIVPAFKRWAAQHNPDELSVNRAWWD